MRFDFATPEWFVMFRDVIDELEPPGDAEAVTFSELYRHVPREIAGHDGPVGWHVRVEGAGVDFQPSFAETADIVIEVDYDFARDMLQEFDAADPEARGARKAAYATAAATRKFEVRGDLSRSPVMLRPLHDLLAERTVQAQGR